jgi:hypothetical protein
MSYFNHAFQKTFVGYNGFVTDPGLSTSDLTLGEFTFVDPKTWTIPTDLDPSTALKCPLVLVSGSIHPNDKIGPFHGGYSESVKSKTINPKYVSSFYKVESCPAQQAQITVGANVENYEGSCAKEFLCGETYSLRLDIKGSPALRYLTRNSYYTSGAYTGCCPADAIAPVAVNPLIVYTKWAYDFLNSILINPFIHVAITYSTDAGTTWQAFEPVNADDSTTAEALLPYTLEGAAFPPGTDETTLAGLIITGAYADTRFQDCTFYPNDSIISFLEPVKLFASEVDLNGDPCAFTGLCENDICQPIQLKGTGETIIRDLILTEGYMQQPFYTGTDLRIREITNGNDVTAAISRTSYYTSYYIQHSVPRFNNPTGTFDNEQYLLEIAGAPQLDTFATSNPTFDALTGLTTFTVDSTLGAYVGGGVAFDDFDSDGIIAGVSGTTITVTGDFGSYGTNVIITFFDPSLIEFETFVNTWLENCGACETMTAYDCPRTCTPVDPNQDNG